VECATCGKYGLDKFVFLTGIPDSRKPALSAMARRHYELTGRPWRITAEDRDETAPQVPGRNDVPSKVRYLLGYLAQKSRFPGEGIVLNGATDYPICFAANAEKFGFYLRYIKNAGFVDEHDSGGHAHHQYCLTPGGWQEAGRVPTLESPHAFVAMSFADDGKFGPLLRRAYDEAIMPAVELDAGYEAIRVDRREFLGDIVFEIIARIKESRFLVADVTEHRNGVYFEAGYAMGMGLPVIWMCHKDEMAHAHFDTSHLNHIVWDKPAELRKSLGNRIVATIGRGPKGKPG
jgi:hypothetical protein